MQMKLSNFFIFQLNNKNVHVQSRWRRDDEFEMIYD